MKRLVNSNIIMNIPEIRILAYIFIIFIVKDRIIGKIISLYVLKYIRIILNKADYSNLLAKFLYI